LTQANGPARTSGQGAALTHTGETVLPGEDKIMTINLAKAIGVLLVVMFILIWAANLIA